MRLLDQATCNANHERFVRRIVESEIVWYLSHPDGVANSVSNEDEETTILLFWSDRAYATRAKKETFPEFEEASMDLFDFLFRWLPGMSGDGVLAGTNWTQDLIGVEKDPYELREEIDLQLPKELADRHQEKYNQLTGSE
ncbi:MAG: DUF2750 domain-containing protein [Desulfobacter sp.]|nr:MAG: DUF2750 domain-containing protein [Desulfobacter sp.]